MVPLSELMELDELLPIEQEEFMRSQSSADCFSFPPVTQKRVSFGGVQSIHHIESSMDMTDEDVEDRWFTKTELAEFKSNARNLFKRELEGTPVDQRMDSTRGMDIYLPQRQRTHTSYVRHVFEAYHFRCQGHPEYVAELCQRWTSKSRERAHAIGIQDYYAAHATATTSVHSRSMVPSDSERTRSL